MTNLILKAPKEKFRAIGVDTFSSDDWVIGDFLDEAEAKNAAQNQSGQMLKTYVYSSTGIVLFEAGTF